MKKLWQKLLLGRKGDERALQSPKKEPIAINRAVTALRKVDAHRKELKRKKKRSEMEIEKPVLFSLPKDESLLPVSKIQLGRSKAQTLETTLPDRELSL